jgi:hypothetical protein
MLDGPDAITITVAVAVDKKTADEGRSLLSFFRPSNHPWPLYPHLSFSRAPNS